MFSDRSHEDPRLFRLLLSCLALAFGVFFATLNAQHLPETENLAAWIPLRCPIKWLLGLSCPTCGLGRSLLAAALGRYQESQVYHPFGLSLYASLWILILLRVNAPKAWTDILRLASLLTQRFPGLLWYGLLAYLFARYP